jgi:hypothetical protein
MFGASLQQASREMPVLGESSGHELGAFDSAQRKRTQSRRYLQGDDPAVSMGVCFQPPLVVSHAQERSAEAKSMEAVKAKPLRNKSKRLSERL